MTKHLIRSLRQTARSTDLTWRYLLNRRMALDYRRERRPLAGGAAEAARRLRADGIAILPAETVLGADPATAGLLRAAEQVQARSANHLDALRDAYLEGGSSRQKPYSIGLLAPAEALAPDGAFARFALAGAVREVVNAYFGMYAVLTHCDIWHNFVATGPPSQSQLWHRDPEDRHILKLFLYLTDVDEGAGPFTYARGSHRHPDRVAPYRKRDGETPRSDDAQLATVYPRRTWLTAYGARGTLVFADTRGYHKGGWSRDTERVVFVAEFLSAAAARGISTRHALPEPGRTSGLAA